MMPKTSNKDQVEKEEITQDIPVQEKDRIQRSPHDRENPYVMISKDELNSLRENQHEQSNYWTITPGWVLTHKKLSQGAKILYGVISGYTKKQGYCWASNERLSECVSVSLSQVKRYISELEKLKLIIIETIEITKFERRRHIWLAEAFNNREIIEKSLGTTRQNSNISYEGSYMSSPKAHKRAINSKVYANSIYERKVVKEKSPPPDPSPPKRATPYRSLSQEERKQLELRLGKERLAKYETKLPKYKLAKRPAYELISEWAMEDDNNKKIDTNKLIEENKEFVTKLIESNKIIKKEFVMYKNHLEIFPGHQYTVCISFADSDFRDKVKKLTDKLPK